MSAPANPPVPLPAKPRILVVSLRRIGDALLTTPLIRSLRRAWPDATIDVLTFAGPARIIEGNPDVDHVIAAPERPTTAETLSLVARLFKRYHLAVSTQPGDRPTFFAVLAGRTHAGLTDADGPRLGHIVKAPRPSSQHAGGAGHPSRRADAAPCRRARHRARARAGLPGGRPPAQTFRRRPYAVIHAAPTFRYKQWTREGWRALAAGLARRGLTIVATSGPDAAERRDLEALWQGIATVHSLTWPGNAALLAGARIYVGPDTSITHLAAATGCPTVALFGPTDPRVWGPWPVGGMDTPWQASGTIQNRGNVWIVQNPLPCLPCTFEGCERHIGSESICLQELHAEQVLAAADQALAKGR